MTLADLPDGAPFVFTVNPTVVFMRLHAADWAIAYRTVGPVPGLAWGAPETPVASADLYDPATREHYIPCVQCRAELVAVPMPVWNRARQHAEAFAAEAAHFRCAVCAQGVM